MNCQRASLVKLGRTSDFAAHHQARKRKGFKDIAFKR